tara:strand:- start:39217 stop:39321 length:105 start_codon:yes stop_codon:yes gene_type:complete
MVISADAIGAIKEAMKVNGIMTSVNEKDANLLKR